VPVIRQEMKATAVSPYTHRPVRQVTRCPFTYRTTRQHLHLITLQAVHTPLTTFKCLFGNRAVELAARANCRLLVSNSESVRLRLRLRVPEFHSANQVTQHAPHWVYTHTSKYGRTPYVMHAILVSQQTNNARKVPFSCCLLSLSPVKPSCLEHKLQDIATSYKEE
jgi:hypothetical protein